MWVKIAAASASASATLPTKPDSSTDSQTPVPALATRMRAYGSLMSGSSDSVSAARDAATMTAVEPTLVAMSQVSSWLRSELMR
jgi:hypothetical protein